MGEISLPLPSPQPSSREELYHIIQAPSAGERADRRKLKNLSLVYTWHGLKSFGPIAVFER